jgi:hypothetical protein
MNTLVKNHKLKFAVLMATTVLFSGSVFADNADDGFAGEGSGTGAGVEFDNSEKFVPPGDLPIVDVYIKESLSLSEVDA